MTFINTFDELNKLYEETTVKAEVSMEEGIFGKKPSHALIVKLDEPDNGYEWYALAVSSDVAKLKKAESEAHASYQKNGTDTQTKIVDIKTATKLTGDKKFASVDNLDEACEQEEKEELVEEAAEDDVIEIEDDEVPADEAVSDEPKQIILECSKCGALVIKPEADIIVDEESDLVNVEDNCEFCEEANGFKIIGVVTPYEKAEEEVTEGLDERYDDEIGNGWNRSTPYSSQSGRGVWKNETPDWWKKQGGTDSSWSRAKEQNHENNKPYRP